MTEINMNQENKSVAVSGNMDMSNEQWKTIEGFTNYKVSSMGRVKRKGYWNSNVNRYYPEKLLKPSLNTETGILGINIKDDNGKQRFVAVRTLVAEAFIPNPFGYKWVTNLNGNPKDNCVMNVTWRPYKHTQEHKEKIKKARQRKHTHAVMVEIDHLCYPSKAEASRRIGINVQRLSRYLNHPDKMPMEFKLRGLRYYDPYEIAVIRERYN